jgi:hypothetical protein
VQHGSSLHFNYVFSSEGQNAASGVINGRIQLTK